MFKVMIIRMLIHVRRTDGYEKFNKEEKICKKKKKKRAKQLKNTVYNN